MANVSDRILLLDVLDTLVQDPFPHVASEVHGIPSNELVPQLDYRAWVEFELGRIDESTYFERAFHDRRSFDHAAYRRSMFAAYRWVEGMELLCTDCAAAGVEMHLVSNYPAWFREIEARLQLSQRTPWTFVSCEQGLRKPDAAAFHRVRELLEVPFGQMVLVDDRAPNVEAARALGIDALRFRGAGALRTDLRNRGLPV